MATLAHASTRRTDWRVVLFRAAAVLASFVFLAAGGISSLLVPWGSPGAGFRGFTPELHRWHSAQLGVSEAILLPGLLLALFWKPRERPFLMQFFVLAGIALVVPHFLIRGTTPISSAFILLPLVAFPDYRALLRLPPRGLRNTSLLAMSGLAAVALARDFWGNLQAQLANVGAEHAHQGHWASSASLDVVLVLGILAAAWRPPGYVALVTIVAASFMYLGLAAIALPSHAGSWGPIAGIAAVAGAAALLFVVWRERRA